LSCLLAVGGGESSAGGSDGDGGWSGVSSRTKEAGRDGKEPTPEEGKGKRRTRNVKKNPFESGLRKKGELIKKEIEMKIWTIQKDEREGKRSRTKEEAWGTKTPIQDKDGGKEKKQRGRVSRLGARNCSF